MIDIKTKDEIEVMRQGGRILAQVLSEVLRHIKPGISELELDSLAERLIREKGAESAFKRVKGYKYTICVSTNDVVVHGIPTEYKLREGDIVGIDCGVYYKGFNTDMAETIEVKPARNATPARNSVSTAGWHSVAGGSGKLPARNALARNASQIDASGSHSDAGGEVRSEKNRFLTIGKRALEEAIKVARIGNRIGHISKTIQDIVEKEGGYSIVRTLVGHGIGRLLHEELEVPGFLQGKIEYTKELVPGMTLAIEVIYNRGRREVSMKDSDGWTIRTKDESLSSLFERTIAITKVDPIVLTS